MVLPKSGTPEWERFVKKAANPNSLEAGIMRQIIQDGEEDQQRRVRELLHHMIEIVPGQMFRDIGRFHEKFGLVPTDHPHHMLPEDLLKFRIRFMAEELAEYCASMSMRLMTAGTACTVEVDPTGEIDVEKAFDGLIDLVYVALGTAFLHRFPFNDGWARVQAANMAKERASGADDERSTRKHSADIVKPAGWKPPVLHDLLGPYANIHKLLRDEESVSVLLVVESPELAHLVQGDFNRDRCLVVGKGVALPAGKGFDFVVLACDVDQEYQDVDLKIRLNPMGRIVSMVGAVK